MATAAPKAAANSPNADAPKSKKMLFLILGAVLLLGAGVGGAWYFLGSAAQHNGAAAKAAPAPAKPPVFMSLESFTVNLQMEDGQQQFLQVGMTLQVADQAQSDLIKLYLPQVRSRLLLLLSSKKASEILTVEGKKKLSDDVRAQLKQPFAAQGPLPDVSNVFFTSFVVQ